VTHELMEEGTSKRIKGKIGTIRQGRNETWADVTLSLTDTMKGMAD